MATPGFAEIFSAENQSKKGVSGAFNRVITAYKTKAANNISKDSGLSKAVKNLSEALQEANPDENYWPRGEVEPL